MRRRNPSLLILSNPERVPGEHVGRKTWGKFHLKGGEKAGIQKIPDVPGMPKTVVVLGALEQMTLFWKRGLERMDFKRSIKNGPWLVMDTDGKTLYVVAKNDDQLFFNAAGTKCASIAYWPGPNSGKHAKPGFLHEFGEGGRLPKARWRLTWPKIRRIHARAIELVRPAKFGYTIEDRGIVG